MSEVVFRTSLAKGQLELLIRVGAFRFTGLDKSTLRAERDAALEQRSQRKTPRNFFAEAQRTSVAPPVVVDTGLEQMRAEFELLGMPLGNPFKLMLPRQRLDTLRAYTVRARDLPRYAGRTVRILGYYVCRKRTTTKHGDTMYFGCWYDEYLDFYDTTHFPAFLRQFPFRGKGIYIIEGRVDMEFGFASLTVLAMELLEKM